MLYKMTLNNITSPDIGSLCFKKRLLGGARSRRRMSMSFKIRSVPVVSPFLTEHWALGIGATVAERLSRGFH